ncbi:lysophospholipid acyltransferase family protein [Devosia sp. ZB163]|uniref:lysophospholipid acyltransferase family protein n=1 Tax=Devosia sp. ZB163 TaxID=3025938 RepID=UPI00235F907E|nr:lysophospholipid acyltransferase family protein [Devosia sp. ZB163]MDC9826441.1 lysophospholipid acyltransferase family protein [Devosia sp. ZB163]
MIGQAIRSLLFYAFFYLQTVPLAIIVGLSAVLRGRTKFGWAIALYWIHSNLFALRWLAGIRTDVAGEENIPADPCIIASKHMSDWDIFALLPGAERPAFIAKKELMDIPFFGKAAMAFDTIRVDRSRGGDAIPMMLEDARKAAAGGARIIIFPEGTRKAPLEPHDYRYGVVRLYEALNVPVVPVALNSGLFWGRNSLLLWRGTARARFLPAIPPGLPTEEFRARLITAIEGETNRLILSAYEEGLKRPIDPALREKLDKLAQGIAPAAVKPTIS